MKNRRLSRIIALVVAAVICLTACSQNVEPAPQETEPAMKNTVEKVVFERIWKYDEEQDHDIEYAIILGVDSNGESVWSHVTAEYPVSQVDLVEEVLSTKTQYIFCENGSLTALDISTGEVLWENRDFEGFGAWGVEANNGNLYFCSYMGTSFFAADRDGKTLHKIKSFGTEYAWAHDIRIEGDKIAVTLDLGPEELCGPEGFVMLVDPSDYSFELQNPGIPEAEPVVLPALAGDIAQVLPMEWGSVAVLYTDGTVGVAGNDELAKAVSSWKNVTELYLGTEESNLTARMKDGTAVSTEYDLSGWSNVKEIYIGHGIAGLREDGRVHAVGWEENSPDGWTEIRDIALMNSLCFGLKNDGTIICTEENHVYAVGLCSLENVRELHTTKSETDYYNTIYAIQENGRAVRYDSHEAWYDEDGINYLDGAVKFADDEVYSGWPFGVSADGELLSHTTRQGWVYYNSDGDFTNYPVSGTVHSDGDGNLHTEQDNTEDYYGICINDGRFQNIKDICYCEGLIMLKNDGTVDSVNVGMDWDFSEWKGIEKITTAGYGDVERVYGVRGDGSVIVAEAEYHEKSNSVDNYLGWNVLELYSNRHVFADGGMNVVGITPEGTLVGDGSYADTDFSVLIR